MYIRNLMEDTGSISEPGRRMICEHGLSFYLETPRHKLLFDLGATDAFLANARQAGIDVSQVDTAVISHGHYDHGGGLEAFLEANHRASVYLREGAFDPHISLQGENIHRIGLEPKLQENPRIHLLREDTWLDEELFVFGNVTERRLWSQSTGGSGWELWDIPRIPLSTNRACCSWRRAGGYCWRAAPTVVS